MPMVDGEGKMTSQSERTRIILKRLLMSDRPMDATRWLVDVVIAAGAFGFGMLQMTISVNLLLPDEFTRMMLGIRSFAPSALAILAVVLTCLPLVIRERFPWAAFALCAGFWLFFTHLLEIWTLSLAGPLVALFTVAYERSRIECIVGGVLMLGCVFVTPFLASAYPSSFNNFILLQNTIIVVAVTLAGYAFHVREEFLEAAEERAVQAEQLREAERLRAEEALRTAEAEASQRVEAERVRIAREVHDITAHSLSAVNIQSSVALRLMDDDPQAAKDAMQAVRDTSKDALAEMRAMIGVLRGDAPDAQTHPTQGTERLGDLLDYLESAGIQGIVDEAEYDRTQVPAYIDIALFGIAREAVTNIVRHAHATHASLRLERRGDVVILSVADDGQGVMEGESPSGHGLQGMRERVHVLGGTFQTGASKAGGFALEARIPLSTASNSHSSQGGVEA